MNSTIKANVTRMFENIDPCNVSASKAELGPSAARLTWDNAMRIAGQAPSWLESPIEDACVAMRAWTASTGAWDDHEIDAMATHALLALFVQNVASELRMLGSDDHDLIECVTTYQEEAECPIGFYWADANDDVHVDYYTGV